MANSMDQCFKINLSVMKFLRLYTPTESTFYPRIQAFIPCFLFTVLLPLWAALNVMYGEIDLMRINYIVVCSSEVLTFALKLMPFITKNEQIKECIFFFGDPEFNWRLEEQRKIIDHCYAVIHRNSKNFLIILGAIGVFWSVQPVFKPNQIFPLDVWLPFNVEKKSSRYFSIYGFCTMGVIYAASCTVIDPLIAGLAYLATGQLRVLKYNLQHLWEHSSTSEELHENIRQSIRCHIAILKFVKLFEDCFAMGALGQFVTSTIVISFSSFQLGMTDDGNINTLTYVVCILVLVWQIYFYCYYGTLLYLENYGLTNAIYMGQWYEYDVESRRYLIALMESSKKPLVVTAGKLIDLSMDTFTTLLRRSYSLFAVLKNYY